MSPITLKSIEEHNRYKLSKFLGKLNPFIDRQIIMAGTVLSRKYDVSPNSVGNMTWPSTMHLYQKWLFRPKDTRDQINRMLGKAYRFFYNFYLVGRIYSVCILYSEVIYLCPVSCVLWRRKKNFPALTHHSLGF